MKIPENKIVDINFISDLLQSHHAEAFLISFINPYSYNLLRNNEEIINEIDYFCADGILMVKILRLFFDINITRTSFDMTSLAPIVFNLSQTRRTSLYFVGARETEVIKFIEVIKLNYPSVNILGYRNGYFSDKKERNLEIENICKLKPGIVIVGMGTPLQEKFLVDLRRNGWIGLGFTCGGFLHQTQNRLDYYPYLINKLNLRMPYRLIKEKLYHRLTAYPKFIINILSDRYNKL